jgi:hypothetical protein
MSAGGPGPSWYRAPSGRYQVAIPGGPSCRSQPYSWTSRWWKPHSRARLVSSVRPPRTQCSMWWQWRNRRAPQPGIQTAPVPEQELAAEPPGRSPLGPPDPNERAVPVADDDLEATVASEPSDDLGVGQASALELTGALVSDEGRELGVDHHSGAIGLRVGPDPGRSEDDEGIRPPFIQRSLSGRGAAALVDYHLGEPAGDPCRGP